MSLQINLIGLDVLVFQAQLLNGEKLCKCGTLETQRFARHTGKHEDSRGKQTWLPEIKATHQPLPSDPLIKRIFEVCKVIPWLRRPSQICRWFLGTALMGITLATDCVLTRLSHHCRRFGSRGCILNNIMFGGPSWNSKCFRGPIFLYLFACTDEWSSCDEFFITFNEVFSGAIKYIVPNKNFAFCPPFPCFSMWLENKIMNFPGKQVVAYIHPKTSNPVALKKMYVPMFSRLVSLRTSMCWTANGADFFIYAKGNALANCEYIHPLGAVFQDHSRTNTWIF